MERDKVILEPDIALVGIYGLISAVILRALEDAFNGDVGAVEFFATPAFEFYAEAIDLDIRGTREAVLRYVMSVYPHNARMVAAARKSFPSP
jgi:hypothetical protein